ncbi:hypothetical protein VPIG_00017 [Vibrio phage PWH3a-P1]|uniref:hypothetical protein n=1 Tax=Vibrio phage PWH3a-P1 TaxID=754058 RepID=UPI0002C07C6C|nr:hypothetical protein VPIG_00017 [Vibrio phage PWH3a-P1]AGH31875.1 hypothetical protein VPIG_00017 [Vibrio phage PWH3a-P1]
MSVDAILFVTCGKDKTQDVGSAVKKALDHYVREILDKAVEKSGAINRGHFIHNGVFDSSNYCNGVSSIETTDFSFFRFHFKNGDENSRVLCMYTDCSCDYSDTYEGDKIIFGIGHWGDCDGIMKVVAEAVKPFGDVYYDHNDCDTEDFVKLS